MSRDIIPFAKVFILRSNPSGESAFSINYTRRIHIFCYLKPLRIGEYSIYLEFRSETRGASILQGRLLMQTGVSKEYTRYLTVCTEGFNKISWHLGTAY